VQGIRRVENGAKRIVAMRRIQRRRNQVSDQSKIIKVSVGHRGMVVYGTVGLFLFVILFLFGDQIKKTIMQGC